MALDTSNWSREDLVREAQLQTRAIQRLYVYLRIGYSLDAIGFLLAYWSFYGGGPAWAGPVGIICLVVGVPVSILFKLGTMGARRNVAHILKAANVELDESGVPRPVGQEAEKGAAKSDEPGKGASQKDA